MVEIFITILKSVHQVIFTYYETNKQKKRIMGKKGKNNKENNRYKIMQS